MQDFVFFSNTAWSHAPRLRHQLARLIAGAGHRVTFFELPEPCWRKVDHSPREVEPRIRLIASRQLLHHQLRLVSPLQLANAAFVRQEIRTSLPNDIDRAKCTVVNFRYEYSFLKTTFPGCRIMTFINDDFEAQCRMPFRGHITKALAATCRASDEVYVVSVPLQRRLSTWCAPKLFLPWSVVPYRAPSTDMDRRINLLFWGHIDTVLDLDMVRQLAKSLQAEGKGGKVLLVGPTEHARRRISIVSALRTEVNVEILGRTNLEDLALDTMLAAILPHSNLEWIRAITLANKSMQLLAHGLPLMISAMPDYLKMPFILRLDASESIGEVLARCRNGFLSWQGAMREFVDANGPASRLQALDIPTVLSGDV